MRTWPSRSPETASLRIRLALGLWISGPAMTDALARRSRRSDGYTARTSQQRARGSYPTKPTWITAQTIQLNGGSITT